VPFSSPFAWQLIPVFGFGDISTTDKSVFPFFPDARPCNGVQYVGTHFCVCAFEYLYVIMYREALTRYTEIAPHIQLSGPTSFAPLINAAINVVEMAR